MSRLVLSFAALGLLLVPTKTFAGAWIKEHDCVGRDTFLKLTEDSPAEPGVESAGCTPVNAMVQPVIMPPGPPNAYGPEDIDDILFERFDHFGALEVLTPAHQFGGSNIWQSIPTIKEPGVLQPGFPASFDYYIGLKYIPMGDIEVTCSVCAMRPQGKGPQETVAVLGGVSDAPITCDDPVCAAVNLPDQYWRASASVDCSNRANQSAPPCGQALMSLKTPGKTFFVDNPGGLLPDDLIKVRIEVPKESRLSARMDVTSCEISYLRGCKDGEGQAFPNNKELCNPL
jgi:hypothetical protein